MAVLTYDEFIAFFPEFSDAGKYPPARVNAYLQLAASRMNECFWGDSYGFGQALWAAHYLATAGMAGGGGSGVVTGEVSSKKVGDVQVTYATSSDRAADAGWWNSTIYGRQWWDINSLFGVGAVQLI